MRRLYGALVVLFIAVGLMITGFLVNTHTAQAVLADLQEAYSYARNGDTDRAKNSLTSARQRWDERLDTMLLFESHGRLDEIEEALHKAQDYLDRRELSLFLAECSSAALLTEHFISVEYPYWNNIF